MPSKLRLLFTMRQDAAAAMTDGIGDHTKHLALSASYYEADFRKFVGRRSRHAFATKMMPAPLMEDIRSSVFKVANGNYLHASLTIERIASLPREDMIRNSIAEPPIALADAAHFTLKHLMRNLSSESQADFEVGHLPAEYTCLIANVESGYTRLGELRPELFDDLTARRAACASWQPKLSSLGSREPAATRIFIALYCFWRSGRLSNRQRNSGHQVDSG